MIGWPYSTLYRFIYFLQFKKEDRNLSEVIFFINSNGKFLQRIYSTIINEELFFTYHCSFVGKPYQDLTYEKNSKSLSYIPYEQGVNYEYLAGGFHGGETKAFTEMCKELSERIFEDERKGYIAIWHDESHINNYFLEYPPTIVLGEGFSCPEEQLGKHEFIDPTILFLNKGEKKNELRKYLKLVELLMLLELRHYMMQ
jgi:hypothetical protein